ncbi:DNA (cytosine-5)-methyltransferase DRM2-like [Macadamia integrifolia]|uniref:DNA (cytosine-5)-methyltransferase DRM2-like n=1 Tax=Macadamia integrifolia TaxID=60698 RepID=UPI001C4F8AFF|nr:DNA (cytosine-5)-methyltransferase DRM2-like [Macadamia integrifolia]
MEDLPVDKEKKLLHLVEMGFLIDDASLALEKCGQHASIMELVDFISASQIEKITTDAPLQESANPSLNENELRPSHFLGDHPQQNKRKLFEVEEIWEKKIESLRRKESYKKGKKPVLEEEEETIHVPKLMIGFGVPNMLKPVFNRKIPSEAIGPPYFYFENVAYAPKGAWDTMSRFLCEIKPEFVDSIYFCAAARKRGYIHNLPIHNRFPLQPIPPLTIQEAFPLTKKWWPSWDKRTKLNCIRSKTGNAKVTERIRQALQSWDEEPSLRTQNYILDECKNWNLVWVGKNKVSSLDPEEIEMLMGYPKHHTRGGGTSSTDRFKALGNSFQYFLSSLVLVVLR